jgi:uncharacterized membrane protein
MAHRGMYAAVAALACSSVIPATQAKPQETFCLTHLGTRHSDDTFNVSGLNDKGEIVGYRADASGELRPFIWRANQFHDFAPPGLQSPFLYFINNRSDVTGVYRLPDFWSFGFFLHQEQISRVEAVPGERATHPTALNNRGQIVGTSFHQEQGNQYFLWERGQATLLEPVPGAEMTSYQKLNDRGVVLGSSGPFSDRSPILWEHGDVTLLQRPAGTSGADPRDINNHNQVIAQLVFSNNNSVHSLPYVWDEGQWTKLPLPYPDQTDGAGSDINNHGTVVGYTTNNRVWDSNVATLWRNGTATDLNTVPCQNDPLRPYVRLKTAQLINDRGWIVVNGVDSRDPPSWDGFYLLTPHR